MGDNVRHPPHYHPGKFEVIKVIEAWDLGFNLGNAVKYIARHRLKGSPIEDLQKAAFYIEHEIARLGDNPPRAEPTEEAQRARLDLAAEKERGDRLAEQVAVVVTELERLKLDLLAVTEQYDRVVIERNEENARAESFKEMLDDYEALARGHGKVSDITTRDFIALKLRKADEQHAERERPSAPTVPGGFVDERDFRRVSAQLEAMTKERDGAVHALGAAKAERDAARRTLAEGQHELEAARVLHQAHVRDDASYAAELTLRRRCERGVALIDSLGSKDTPAMVDLRGILTGEKS